MDWCHPPAAGQSLIHINVFMLNVEETFSQRWPDASVRWPWELRAEHTAEPNQHQKTEPGPNGTVSSWQNRNTFPGDTKQCRTHLKHSVYCGSWILIYIRRCCFGSFLWYVDVSAILERSRPTWGQIRANGAKYKTFERFSGRFTEVLMTSCTSYYSASVCLRPTLTLQETDQLQHVTLQLLCYEIQKETSAVCSSSTV